MNYFKMASLFFSLVGLGFAGWHLFNDDVLRAIFYMLFSISCHLDHQLGG